MCSSSFSKTEPNCKNNNCKTRFVDIDRARRLFAGVESLMREARASNDPRVLLDALRLLSLQSSNLRELFVEVAR